MKMLHRPLHAMAYALRGTCVRAKSFATWTLVVVAYYMWFQGFYNKIAYGQVVPYTSFDVGVEAVAHNFIPIATLFALNHLVVFTFTKAIKRTSLKVTADVLGSLLSLAAVNMCYFLIMSSPAIDWAGSLFNNIFIFLGMEVAYYMSNYRRTLEDKERKQRQMLQYQYDALKAQVNPHFLFNSLNILYSLIDIDVAKSRDFVMSLSQMYRYIMMQHDKERVALSEEMVFLYAYVDVLKMRYHNCFAVNIKGEDNIGQHEVIPYCMQLLIENVTKHNVIQTNTPMVVDIDIQPTCLSVSNRVCPKRNATSSGIGLHYISELYRYHGKTFSYANDGKTFTATVPFLT